MVDGAVIIDIITDDSKAIAKTSATMTALNAMAKKTMTVWEKDNAKLMKQIESQVGGMSKNAQRQISLVGTANKKETALAVRNVSLALREVQTAIHSSSTNITGKQTTTYQKLKAIVKGFGLYARAVFDTVRDSNRRSLVKMETDTAKSTAKMKNHFGLLGLGVRGIFVSMAIMVAHKLQQMVADSARAARDFDKNIRNMQAIGEWDEEERQIYETYIKETVMKGDSVFSPEEMIEAATGFVATGYALPDVKELSEYALKLGYAGSKEGMTAEDATAFILAMKEQMHMTNEQVGVAIDQLVKTANASAAGIPDLAKAWERLGGMAYIYGQDTATINSVLASMSTQVKGEQAGTQARNIMRWFYQPNSVGKKALESIGVSAFDESGDARNLMDVIADFSIALGAMDSEHLTDYLATLYGQDVETVNEDGTVEVVAGKDFVEGIMGVMVGENMTQQELLETLNKVVGAREIAATATIMSAVNTQYGRRSIIEDSEGAVNKFIATLGAGASKKWEGFMNQWSGLMLGLGQVLMPAVLTLMEAVSPFITEISNALESLGVGTQSDGSWLREITNFGKDIRLVVAEIDGFFTDLFADQEKRNSFGATMKLLKYLTMAFIVGLVALGRILMWIVDLSIQGMMALAEGFGIGLKYVSWIADYFLLVFIKFYNDIVWVLNKLGADLETIPYDAASTKINAFGDAIGEFVNTIGEEGKKLKTAQEMMDKRDKAWSSDKPLDTASKGKTTSSGYQSSGGSYSGAANVVYVGYGSYDVRTDTYTDKRGNVLTSKEVEAKVKKYHTGGFVDREGLALLDGGEMVSTNSDQEFLANELRNKRTYESVLPRVISNATELILDSINGNKIPTNITLNLDGRAVAQGMFEHNVDENKRRGVI